MSGEDRVELRWPGKVDATGRRVPELGEVEPLLERERYRAADGTASNLLVAGDNLAVLPALLERVAGQAAVLYLDPPFSTGDTYRVRRRSGRAGAPDDVGSAYEDRSTGGLGAFLGFLAPRLELARELLAPTGALFLHLDARTVHAAKLLCDEIFGARRFRNHLVWVYAGRERGRSRFSAKHDDILYYARGARPTFHPERILEPLQASSRRALGRKRDEEGRPFVIRRRTGGGFAAAEDPDLTYRQYLPAGSAPRDWFSVDYARKSERTGYPTQKPEALVARLLAVASDPGDLVVDLFAGSGTAPAVAAALARRWIAVDRSPAAVAITRARMLRAPDAGGGFTLVEAAGPGAGDPQPPDASDEAGVLGALRARLALPATVRLEGPPATIAAVDAWAIGEAPWPGAPFEALAWAARHPWTRALEEAVTLPPGLVAGGLELRAWNATASAARRAVEPAS